MQAVQHPVLISLGCLVMGMLAGAQSGPVTVASPDGFIMLRFSIAPISGQFAYEVSYKGKPLLDKSNLGFDLQDQPGLGSSLEMVSAKTTKIQETYLVLAGKSNPIQNECSEVTMVLRGA